MAAGSRDVVISSHTQRSECMTRKGPASYSLELPSLEARSLHWSPKVTI